MPTLQEQINALKTQATGFARRILALETKTTATDAAVASVSTKVNTVTGSVSQLASSVTGLTSRTDQLATSVGSLSSEVAAVKTALSSSSQNAVTTSENLALLAETVDSIAEKLTALEETVANLADEDGTAPDPEPQPDPPVVVDPPVPDNPEPPVIKNPYNLALKNPVWSGRLKNSYGVCSHPTYANATYGNVDAVMNKIAAMGAPMIRGMYSATSANSKKTVELCRTLGIKWLMLIVPEETNMTKQEVDAKIAHIALNAADVCIAIEGPNEPNHNKSDLPVSPTWAEETVAFQKLIWDAVKARPELAHVVVIGPSLHDAVPTAQQDYTTLKNAGILNYMDACGLHCYQGGRKPDGEGKVQQRLGWIRNAYGNVPVWISETGYHNGMNVAPTKHEPTPEDVAAVYAERMIFDMNRLGVAKHFKYEFLNDVNPGLDDVESNFGLIRTPALDPSTWTNKPEYDVMSVLLKELSAKGPARGVGIPLEVTAPGEVKWTFVDNGANYVIYAHRDVSIYDRKTKTSLTSGDVDMTVKDNSGTRVIKVGPKVTRVPITV